MQTYLDSGSMDCNCPRAVLAFSDGVHDNHLWTSVLVKRQREHKSGWAAAHNKDLCRVG